MQIQMAIVSALAVSVFVGPAVRTPLSAAPAQLAQRGGIRTIVMVTPTDPWTDTGIQVRPGDRVGLRAWGTVVLDRTGSARSVGPQGEGRVDTPCEFLVSNAAVAAGSLVANIAGTHTLDGRGFAVGSRWEGTAPVAGTTSREGALLLGINQAGIVCDRSGYDSWAFRNNTAGAITVEVFVTPGGKRE
jgi:hypothetical protein